MFYTYSQLCQRLQVVGHQGFHVSPVVSDHWAWSWSISAHHLAAYHSAEEEEGEEEDQLGVHLVELVESVELRAFGLRSAQRRMGVSSGP